VNEIGKFTLKGTFLPMSQKSGKLLVYRIYTEMVQPPARSPPKPRNRSSEPLPQQPILQRKASSRTIKKINKDVNEGPVTLTKVMKECSTILRELVSADVHKIFTEPVDAVALNLPTYNEVIKEPMDFRTIREKVTYTEMTHTDFERLVLLALDNALLFNNKEQLGLVYTEAIRLKAMFQDKFKQVAERERAKQAEANRGSSNKNRNKRKSMDDSDFEDDGMGPSDEDMSDADEGDDDPTNPWQEPPSRPRQQPKKKKPKAKRQRTSGGGGGGGGGGGYNGFNAAGGTISKAQHEQEMAAMQSQLMQQMERMQQQMNQQMQQVTQQVQMDQSRNELWRVQQTQNFTNGPSIIDTFQQQQKAEQSAKALAAASANSKGAFDGSQQDLSQIPLTAKEHEMVRDKVQKFADPGSGADEKAAKRGQKKLEEMLSILRKYKSIDDSEVEIAIDELPANCQREMWTFCFGARRTQAEIDRNVKKAKKKDDDDAWSPGGGLGGRRPQMRGKGGKEAHMDLGVASGVEHVPLGADVDPTGGFKVGVPGEADDDNDILDILGDEFDTEEDTSAWGGLSGTTDDTNANAKGGKEIPGKGVWGGKGEDHGSQGAAEAALQQSLQQHAAQKGEEMKQEALQQGEERTRIAQEEEERRKEEEKRKMEEAVRSAADAKARDEAESRHISNMATVDMDEQRLLMERYNQDNMSGSASPSSDYGF